MWNCDLNACTCTCLEWKIVLSGLVLKGHPKPQYNELIVYAVLQFTIASLTFVVVVYIKEILNFSLRHVVMKFLMKFEEK